MLITLITIALLYTTLEVSYWYVRWFLELSDQKLPIVKSLLLSVIIAHAVLIVSLGVRLVSGELLFDKPLFLMGLLVASASHMVCIWKQHINAMASPAMFVLRLLIVTVLIGMMVVEGLNG